MAASTSPTWRPEARSLREEACAPPVDRVLLGPEAAALVGDGFVGSAAYWSAMLTDGPSTLVRNLIVDAGVVGTPAESFPIAVHHGRPGTAFPGSLRTQYVDYPWEELSRVDGIPARLLARVALAAMRVAFRLWGLDHVVQWGANLQSTNLHRPGLGDVAHRITPVLAARFPGHAILVRGVLDDGPGGVPSAPLRKAGYLVFASRRVYLFDGTRPEFLSKDTTRRDLRLLAKESDHRIEGHDSVGVEDAARITRLYRMLYFEKHSHLNPDFTERFVRRAILERWMELHVLRHASGRIDGVYGRFDEAGTASVPFIGYDTGLAGETALYRRMVAHLLSEVARTRIPLNYSSGAGEFKRRRGGRGMVESNALHFGHLTAGRRCAYRTVFGMVERLGRGFLRDNEL